MNKLVACAIALNPSCHRRDRTSKIYNSSGLIAPMYLEKLVNAVLKQLEEMEDLAE